MHLPYLRQLAAVVALTAAIGVAAAAANPPAVGSKAPDFSLTALDGTTVALSAERARGPVVLVLGRGWPGYQCPFCTRQFGELLSHAKDIEASGARVLWIYPGPAADLRAHADAFVAGKTVPTSFRIAVDPDYVMTRAYSLRWDAPSETAYPATFVIDRSGTVRYALVSKSHGGRAPTADVLAALRALEK